MTDCIGRYILKMMKRLASFRVSFLLLVAIVLSAVSSLYGESPSAEKTRIDNSTIVITCDSLVAQGSEIVVGIGFTDATDTLGGFNLCVEYDRGALVFDSVTLGKLTQGEWEYFMSRSGLENPEDSASTLSFVRMIAIADQQDETKKTPAARSLVGPGEMVKLHFYVSERKEYFGRATYLRFIWAKCDDNSFSDKTGNHLYVSHSVKDVDGRVLTPGADKYSGIKKTCFATPRNQPDRKISFVNTKMMIGNQTK